MSKMYSLILVFFISIAALADHPKNGWLTITTYDNADIRVEVDGRRYSNRDNTIRINNIKPGYHSIHVYRRQSSGIFGGTRERLMYSGNIYVKPEHRVDILIDRNGRAKVQERNLDKNRRNNRRDNDNDRWEDYDRWDRNDDRNDHRHDNRNDNRNDDRWDRNDRSGYGRAVSYESFQSMKQSLRREHFENTRLTLAKQMMERNYFETSQVREMLQLFSFESNRLELAKYAYRNTTDRKNYFSIYDVFSFSSSKEELSRYISNFR